MTDNELRHPTKPVRILNTRTRARARVVRLLGADRLTGVRNVGAPQIRTNRAVLRSLTARSNCINYYNCRARACAAFTSARPVGQGVMRPGPSGNYCSEHWLKTAARKLRVFTGSFVRIKLQARWLLHKCSA